MQRSSFPVSETGGSLDAKAAIDVIIYLNANSKEFSATTSFYNASVFNAPGVLSDIIAIPTVINSISYKGSYVDF